MSAIFSLDTTTETVYALPGTQGYLPCPDTEERARYLVEANAGRSFSYWLRATDNKTRKRLFRLACVYWQDDLIQRYLDWAGDTDGEISQLYREAYIGTLIPTTVKERLGLMWEYYGIALTQAAMLGGHVKLVRALIRVVTRQVIDRPTVPVTNDLVEMVCRGWHKHRKVCEELSPYFTAETMIREPNRLFLAARFNVAPLCQTIVVDTGVFPLAEGVVKEMIALSTDPKIQQDLANSRTVSNYLALVKMRGIVYNNDGYMDWLWGRINAANADQHLYCAAYYGEFDLIRILLNTNFSPKGLCEAIKIVDREDFALQTFLTAYYQHNVAYRVVLTGHCGRS